MKFFSISALSLHAGREIVKVVLLEASFVEAFLPISVNYVSDVTERELSLLGDD
jgi:hypothetical protein